MKRSKRWAVGGNFRVEFPPVQDEIDHSRRRYVVKHLAGGHCVFECRCGKTIAKQVISDRGVKRLKVLLDMDVLGGGDYTGGRCPACKCVHRIPIEDVLHGLQFSIDFIKSYFEWQNAYYDWADNQPPFPFDERRTGSLTDAEMDYLRSHTFSMPEEYEIFTK